MNFYKIYLRLFLVVSFVFFSLSCVSDNLTYQKPEVIETTLDLLWPPPPQTPRVKYLKTISRPSDIGIKKSFFSKAAEMLAGREDSEILLVRPYGVYADLEKIYITDPGAHMLHIFDFDKRDYLQIRKARKTDLISPIGVCVDKNGDIYLSDSLLRRVMVFDRYGEYLRDIGSNRAFARPAGVVIDEERVYVVDTHKHQVLVFSKKNGKLLFSFGKNGSAKGEFNFPTNIFMDREKLLYITDSMNFRVQIFDKDGNFISSFGRLGDSTGYFSKPKGIAVDSDGNIYVSDAHFDIVQIFDRDGRLLLTFGNTGRRAGELVLPAGLFIDDKDRIYVADSYNKRIQIFQYLKEKGS